MPKRPDNGEILKFLAATVESMRDKLDGVDVRTARLEGRIDHIDERLGDLDERLGDLDKRMGNLDEHVGGVDNRVGGIEGRLDRIEDRMATKEDVAAIRGDIERVDLRLGVVDRAVSTRFDQMDLSLSRLRSVVYLLVKDKPEMLRLLGQEPGSA